MRVNNYTVAMNTQHFNLQLASTSTAIKTDSKELSNDKSKELQIQDIESSKKAQTNNKIANELSKAILKNIHSESRRVIGDRVEISSSYIEAESLSFSLLASVKTDDREIELGINVNLSRSFVFQAKVRVESLNKLQDPLVINLSGEMPSLSTKTFSFDIDSDGKSDQISQLNSGNGFLALDKNANGQIDDGAELFGTKSGDGFSDLSKYDEDNNGWIDENDAIFDKLRVWKRTDKDNELLSLGEVGIGAIFLGNSKTPFSLKSETNELLGEIRSSGFFLYENGKAGIISQIDFATETETKDGLNILERLEKNLNSLNLESIYNAPEEERTDDNDQISKIQQKIRTLESKLVKAEGDEKAALQVQIGVLFSQLMSMLEVK